MTLQPLTRSRHRAGYALDAALEQLTSAVRLSVDTRDGPAIRRALEWTQAARQALRTTEGKQ